MWQPDLDRATFLREYWQRKALLIPNTREDFAPPLSSDELGGLALEDEVESRLIEQVGDRWQLQNGPFTEADFLRNHPWTLLVQAVDHYIPEVAELQRLFDFIPRWRMDDVMVSFAVDGGSVGPHYDNYDVFLLQGEGHRVWRLGQHCDGTQALLPHDDLRILHSFETSEEYLLGPGDILYVPPGLAHWGIAQGECTTFSIGFRAPQISEMLSRWTDQVLMRMRPEQFYSDAGRVASTRPGEILPSDTQRALAQLRAALDEVAGDEWFGELVTEPRYEPVVDDDDVADTIALLHSGAQCISLSPAAKMAWQQHGAGLAVFINGETIYCAASALVSVMMLCDRRELVETNLHNALSDPATLALLEGLVQRGCLYVD